MDFNTREGYDPTSTETLDESTVDNVTTYAFRHNSEYPWYLIEFQFHEYSDYSKIIVTDVYENSTTLTKD